MIEKAIISLLNAGTYTSVVPSRIYVNHASQSATKPYAVIARTDTTFRQVKGQTEPVTEGDIRIIIVADEFSDCEIWEAEIENELNGVRGVTANGVSVHEIIRTDKEFEFIDPIDAHALSVGYFVRINN